MEEKSEMTKKDYAQIMILFDRDDKTPLCELCERLIREDNPEQVEGFENWLKSHDGEEIYDVINGQELASMHIGFAIGYVIGQDYDIADEEISAIVKDLRERILKAKALPYFQRRERKEPQPIGK